MTTFLGTKRFWTVTIITVLSIPLVSKTVGFVADQFVEYSPNDPCAGEFFVHDGTSNGSCSEAATIVGYALLGFVIFFFVPMMLLFMTGRDELD